jgi:hypothetical protein
MCDTQTRRPPEIAGHIKTEKEKRKGRNARAVPAEIANVSLVVVTG